MKAEDKTPATCPACGTPLPKTDDDFGCRVCLLQAGLTNRTTANERSPGAEIDKLGIYKIIRRDDGGRWELGRGAMGITYRAVDTTLNRPVALKIVDPQLAGRSSSAPERFIREAQAAAALRHQNIATVYHFGIREETGQCFYAMELVEGETLEERVRRAGPLDVKSTIAIAQQVVAALQAAEKRGLLHRDLKPANIMLVAAENENGSLVKIIDFGLAKAFQSKTDPMSLTRGGFVGTPAFASPEQFANTSLDVRSDIYSLGATLWFALTGKTPFPDRNFEEIRNAQQSGRLSIQELKAARVPSRLASLLTSMLALEPAMRPGTDSLGQRLQSCTTSMISSRKRAAVVVVALLILGLTGFWFAKPTTPKVEGTFNAAAHAAYLKGRYFWNKRTGADFQTAKTYFEQAIALDPRYAKAYTGLGDCWQFIAVENVDERKEAYAKSAAANRKALEIDPTLAEAHASLGLTAMNYNWDWPTAEREFRQAIALNPNYATAHQWYAEYLAANLRFAESFREIQRARELDPVSIIINNDAGKFLYFSRRFDEAEAQLKETLKLDPNFSQGHSWLGMLYTVTKRYDEAVAQFQEVQRLDGGTWGLAGLGYVYGRSGRLDEAKRMLQAVEHSADPVDSQGIALIAIGMDDETRVFDCLEKEY